jgi:hypothetical protein
MADTYNIAFMADTHLGYSAYQFTDSKGINLRAKDGERALHEIVNQISESEVPIHAVVHGGDIFHYSHPQIRDIFLFQYYARKLADMGIPFYGLAGNHDASDNRSHMPAVAAVDDPSKGIHALWTPHQKYQLGDGITLHSVGHHGLSAEDAPKITPEQDMVNIFTTHGAALDPKNATLMNCKDSPREQIIPPEMIIDDNFAIRLLGHYHSRYPVGGKLLNTWYAGSTVRRGFSDEAGDRGWLLIKVHPNGSTEVEFKNIHQRPQYDLKVIDAHGLSSSEVQDMIEAQIMATNVDNGTDAFDEAGAPIVRQKVINASRSLRAGLDKKHIAGLTRNMLHWDLSFSLPEIKVVTKQDDDSNEGESSADDKPSSSPSLARVAAGQNNTVEFFNSWVDDSKTLSAMSDDRRQLIKDRARAHLESVQATRKK